MSGGSSGAGGGAVANATPAQQWLIGTQAALQRHGLKARKWLTLSFLVTVWYYFSYEYNTNLKAWLSVTQPGYQKAHGGGAAVAALPSSSGTDGISLGVPAGGDAATALASTSAAEVEYQRQHELAVEASWLSPITLPLLLAIFMTTTLATLPWVIHAAAVTPQLLPAWRRLWTHHTLDMALMCASTVFGTASITVVYEYGSIQLVQVARSIGPLFTTGWAVLLLDQFTYGKPLMCLLATLGGTMLASWKEPTMCVMTLVLMISANTCMTFRNVITRRLLSVLGIGHGHGHGKADPPAPADKQPLLPQQQVGHSSNFTPRAHNATQRVDQEAQPPKGATVALSRSPSTAGAASQHGQHDPEFANIPPTHMASLLLTTGNATGVVVLVATLVLATFFDPKAAALVTEIRGGAVRQLMILGGTNWAYNLASQLVLAQLTVVAHGMLELLKRVFVLVAVSVFAQKANWHWHNVLGACITFLAAALYFHYSHQQKHAAALKAHRSEHLESPFSTPAGSQIRVGSTTGIMRLIKSFVRKQQQHFGGGGASGQQQDHLAELDQDAGRKAGGLGSGGSSQRHHLQGNPDDDETCIVSLRSVPEEEDDDTTTTNGQPIKIIASSHGGAAGTSNGGAHMDAAAVVHINSAGITSANGVHHKEIELSASENGDLHHRSGKHGASTAFAGYAGAKPYGDRSPPHHAHHAAASPAAPSGCVATCLPPSGPPRLSLARAIVIAIMLFTVPLLVPLGSWPYILGSQPRPTVLSGYRLYHLPSGTGSGVAPAASSAASSFAALFGGSDGGAVTSDQPVDEDHGTSAVSGGGDDAAEVGDSDHPQQRRRLRRHRSLLQQLFGEGAADGGGGGGGSGSASDMSVQLVPVSAGGEGTADLQGATSRSISADAAVTSSSSDPESRHLTGFYVGWLGHNNLGDEIVADIFYDLLKEMVEERVPRGATVSMPPGLDPDLDQRHPTCSVKDHGGCHFAVLGGGSTVDTAFVEAAGVMLGAKKPVMLFGSGYQRVHRDPRVQAASLKLLMDGDTLGGIRGYITKDFLLVRTNRTLPVIGDSGFLSGALYPGRGLNLPEVANLPNKLTAGQPIPHWPPAPECIEASRAGRLHASSDGTSGSSTMKATGDEAPGTKCERPLAVVTLRSELSNYDLSKDGLALKDEQDIENLRVPRHPVVIMMLVIAELVNEHHFQVVLQDVDDKSYQAHQRYLRIINKRILPGNPPVVLHKAHDNYHEVMDLYERAAVSINCRLHSGVLAASALRPIVYMASLPKFQDFMSSIGQENFLVNPDSPDLKSAHTADLAKLMVSKVLQAATDAAAISASLERVRDATLSKYKQAVRDVLDRLSTEQPNNYRQAVSNCMSVRITKSRCVAERTLVSIECMA